MDIFPVLKTGKLIVVHSPDAAREESMTLIAELGLRGMAVVVDGGNRYQPYRIATLLRRKTTDISTAANRILVRRAFTCHEMTALLESTPSLRGPHIVLDLLNAFYDDHVAAYEARRLLGICLNQIGRLLTLGPVVVTLAPPLVGERTFLFEELCRHADELLIKETFTRPCFQPSLF